MIPLFKVAIDETVSEDIKNVMLSGFIGQGSKVNEFETKLKPYIGDNVLTVNSGTSALHLALRLANVGFGDEVITTPETCTATNMPILERGGKIVWADINPYTGNISVESIRKNITTKTKAIMVVHWGGYPCDLEELHNIEVEFGIPVIQDSAHAFGATYKGKLISDWTSFCCFSFQAIKHLTTVDGGALVCQNKSDYDRGKLLRWYGIDRETNSKVFRCEGNIKEFGYKFHMNDINATIGLKQLTHIDAILNAHKTNAETYKDAILNCIPISNLNYKGDRVSSYWLYTIMVNDLFNFMSYMKEKEIMVSQVHARNDTHDAFKEFRKEGLIGVDEFCKHQVSIPVGSWLTSENINYIIKSILQY